jgi:primosomal replication protein N
VPVVQFSIAHESEQDEAGGRRQVRAELQAVAFEAQARLLAATQPGREVSLQGFLGAKSRRSRRNVLHVTQIEFKEEGK